MPRVVRQNFLEPILRVCRASSPAWAVIALVTLALPTVAMAQIGPDASVSGTSYVNPFPPGDVYKLQVYGDVFIDGLLQGLSENVRTEERVELPRKPRLISSLIRTEVDEDLRLEEQSRDVVHIGVIMLGLNDRGSLRSPGASSIRFGSPQWKDQYSQRVDRLLKALKRRNIAVYVVGMPPLRKQDQNADLEMINESLVERAFANGIRFIEVTESFTDENGAFSQFGPDSAGNREKLRDGDGVGFTAAGYRKLAGLVATEVKRDLAAARAERAVPLAGSDVEQKRINPDKAGVVAQPAAWKGVVTKDGKELRAQTTAAATAQTTTATSAQQTRPGNGPGDQKAETSRVSIRLLGISGREDVTQVEIVRPAISAAIIALLTRKETVDAVQPPFELLADDVGDGISVSTMVTGLAESATSARRRGPSNQAAYTAVWVKGERLPTKPGRADDFSWPRPSADSEVVPAAATPTKPTASKTGPAGVTDPAQKARTKQQSPRQ